MCTACDGYVTGIQVPPRSGDWKGVKLLEKNDDDDHQILWRSFSLSLDHDMAQSCLAGETTRLAYAARNTYHSVRTNSVSAKGESGVIVMGQVCLEVFVASIKTT